MCYRFDCKYCCWIERIISRFHFGRWWEDYVYFFIINTRACKHPLPDGFCIIYPFMTSLYKMLWKNIVCQADFKNIYRECLFPADDRIRFGIWQFIWMWSRPGFWRIWDLISGVATRDFCYLAVNFWFVVCVSLPGFPQQLLTGQRKGFLRVTLPGWW